VIPPARARALYDDWPAPKRWIEVANAGHNDVGDTAAAWDAIRWFLDEHRTAS